MSEPRPDDPGCQDVRFHEIHQGYHPHRHHQCRHRHRALRHGLDFHHAGYRSARKDLPDVQTAGHPERSSNCSLSFSSRFAAAWTTVDITRPVLKAVVAVGAIFLLITGSGTSGALQRLLFPVPGRLRHSCELPDRTGLRSQWQRLPQEGHGTPLRSESFHGASSTGWSIRMFPSNFPESFRTARSSSAKFRITRSSWNCSRPSITPP